MFTWSLTNQQSVIKRYHTNDFSAFTYKMAAENGGHRPYLRLLFLQFLLEHRATSFLHFGQSLADLFAPIHAGIDMKQNYVTVTRVRWNAQSVANKEVIYSMLEGA